MARMMIADEELVDDDCSAASPTGSVSPKSPLHCLATPFHVRAQFDFDPSHEIGLGNAGLGFRTGCILRVVDTADANWWQATMVEPSTSYTKQQGDEEANLGAPALIPSLGRLEQRDRRRQLHVHFCSVLPSRKVG